MLPGLLLEVLPLMAFDIFSQLQGPQIDTDLFPRARQQGAATGNAIKTPLQAGIEGALQGIQTGFGIVNSYQDTLLKQNEINQLPVKNANEAATLKNNQAIAQINSDKAYIDSQTQQEQLDLTKAQLQQKTDDITNRKEIAEILSNPDPAIRASVYSNPKYTDLLSRDTKLNEYAYGRSYEGLSPQEKDSIAYGIDVFKQRDYEVQKDKLNAAYTQSLLKERDKAVANFQASAPFSYATQGLNSSEIRQRIEAYPTGTKTLNESGTINRELPDKVGAEKDVPLSGEGAYTIYRDGKPILTTSAEEASKFLKYKNSEDALEKLGKDSIYGALSPLERAQQIVKDRRAEAQGNLTPNGITPGNINSFSSLSTESVPSNALQGNSTIVEQKRQQFADLAKNPPPGMSSGTLDQRLLQKKQALRSRLNVGKSPESQSQQAYDLLSQVAPPPDSMPTPKPVDTSTPDAALSSVAKTPVKLKTDVVFKPSSDSYNRIMTNPLLQNQPPLIKGLVSVESGGISDAESPTGVKGLAQVTKATAAQYGLNRDIPEENILAAKLYLYDLWNRQGKDIRLALASYNAGPSNIARAVDKAGTSDWSIVREYLKDILSPKKFKEVYNYPDKVLTAATSFMGQNETDDQFYYGLNQVSGTLVNA